MWYLLWLSWRWKNVAGACLGTAAASDGLKRPGPSESDASSAESSEYSASSPDPSEYVAAAAGGAVFGRRSGVAGVGSGAVAGRGRGVT